MNELAPGLREEFSSDSKNFLVAFLQFTDYTIYYFFKHKSMFIKGINFYYLFTYGSYYFIRFDFAFEFYLLDD